MNRAVIPQHTLTGTGAENYRKNPLVHQPRRLGGASSNWVRSFDCRDVRPLIICRGPIRKEAMDVFDEMGIDSYGILLSEKDSITYTNALSPELRVLTEPDRVHRVPDYTGASGEERSQRIGQIISIARDNGYNAVFAGYGFMAEDEELVLALEAAELNFIGPCSSTVRGAGFKDEAKRTALKVGVSVTPGIDNVTTRLLLSKYPSAEALRELIAAHSLAVDDADLSAVDSNLEEFADRVLQASYDKGIDLYSIDELGEELRLQVEAMYRQYPQNRIRLKAIGGGGGKGQRILNVPAAQDGDTGESRFAAAAARAPELAREILAEVKATGVGDNKNILVELNIESTRHQEIQVIGNGDWAISLGGRDCSLQMHEQKLLEVSVTYEELEEAIIEADARQAAAQSASLRRDLHILERMEKEAARFSAAVGLDSVSTFECIVERDNHFFLEMNTRIQVEHRVTELCYGLEFVNPDNSADTFIVNSLVEAMVLLSRHGARLPRPNRVRREMAAVEARLNATNQALQPHAGSVIRNWSFPVEGEIRDDQGISLHNPDTGVFMAYTLAGAYDSNIALLLTTGVSRFDAYQRLSEIIRVTDLSGKDLATNLAFHYGLVNWFIGHNVNARPTTRFIVPYLTAVGTLKQVAERCDLDYAYQQIRHYSVGTKHSGALAQALGNAIDRKQTLLLRPIDKLFEQPHMLAGWLSMNRGCCDFTDDRPQWQCNPMELLNSAYRFLNMSRLEGLPAAYGIWSHDEFVLSEALSFYQALRQRLGDMAYPNLDKLLRIGNRPASIDEGKWQAARAAHRGFQMGTDILALPLWIAEQTDFHQLKVNEDLSINIPERLLDVELQTEMAKVLVPPPVAGADEILAFSGGMYYPREAPDRPLFVEPGTHFERGDPLYSVEVMKMFNKFYAPFSGTIDKCLVDGEGLMIRKGQPLFKVTPDETIEVESAEAISSRRKNCTNAFLRVIGVAGV